MEEIRSSQGLTVRCRFCRIIVLAGVALAGFYCYLLPDQFETADQVENGERSRHNDTWNGKISSSMQQS